MYRILRAAAACALLAWAPLASPAVQRTETVPLGASPVAAYADASTGKLFVASEGRARTASLAVLERDGRLTTLPLEAAPVSMAGSALLRKLVVVHATGAARVVHLDSLKISPVQLAGTPLRVLVSDRDGEAFVLSRQGADTVVTGIDLKNLVTRTSVIRDLVPVTFASDSAAGRLYLLGARGERGSDPAGSFVLAIDSATLEVAIPATRVGRNARDVDASPSGDAVVVLEQAEARGGSALRVLDSSLSLQRVMNLPEARFSDTVGVPIDGDLRIDPNGSRVWIRDATNARILVANPAAATVSITDLESPPSALALNVATGTAIAVMPQSGQAALLSAGGERLDTVAVGHALAADAAGAVHWPIAIDSQSGDAYVGHGADGIVSLLPRAGNAAVANLTDLWSSAGEPGWGVFIEQQSTTVFAALFTYGSAGEASWFVMSNGTRQPDGSFSGVLFRTQGPTHLSGSNAAPAGIMRIVPSGDSINLTYVVDGNSVTRKVERFAFDRTPRTCGWTAATADATPLARANFTALWSNPTDPGWGLAVSHRKQSAFAVLFTYDDQNRPTWMVMSNGRQQAPGQFTGDLYRVARAKVESMGSMALRFNAQDEGSVSWRMDGTEFRAPLLRQRFAPLVSRCGG